METNFPSKPMPQKDVLTSPAVKQIRSGSTSTLRDNGSKK